MHTSNSAKVKGSYSQRFPKSLMDYSSKVDNKFLNDNLHTIEEMEYRKKGITDGFRNYQNKHYSNREILNHDLYFTHEGKTYPKVSGAQPLNIMNTGFIGSLGVAGVNGADLVTGTGGSNAGSFGANNYNAFRLGDGTIGELYDQVALSQVASAGNVKLAVYDDTGSDAPNDLYAQESGNASAVGYTWRSLTEFDLTTAKNWACFNNDSGGMFPYWLSGTTNVRYFDAETYATSFTTPAPAVSVARYSDIAVMKIGHT